MPFSDIFSCIGTFDWEFLHGLDMDFSVREMRPNQEENTIK